MNHALKVAVSHCWLWRESVSRVRCRQPWRVCLEVWYRAEAQLSCPLGAWVLPSCRHIHWGTFIWKMVATPTIKSGMNLILCDHVCVATLWVLAFLSPLLSCFSIVKQKRLSPMVLLGARVKWPSTKVWFSSLTAVNSKSHSKPQKGKLGRLMNPSPTLLSPSCWTAVLELNKIWLYTTQEKELQEPRRPKELSTTLLWDCDAEMWKKKRHREKLWLPCLNSS